MGIRDEWNSYELYDGESILSKTFMADLGKDQTITEIMCPLTVILDNYRNWYPDDHASTVDSDAYGLYVLVQLGEEPTGTNALLRLEANTKGITLHSAIIIPVAGVPVGDISYLFYMPQTPKLAWSATGSSANINGWLRVNMGGLDRWVALYDDAPT